MKTFFGKRTAGSVLLPLLCAVLLLCVLMGNARAVSTATARLRPDYTIVIDGSARTFYNVNGQQVHPISYQDTTYLPVRAIGELMGKVVSWDEAKLTVTLSGVRTGEAAKGTPETAAVQNISVEVRDDFTVVVDGTVRSFADAGGKTVYPLLYQGSTYLPIRAIGELMGKTVGWDEATKTITLSGTAGTTVTDADVIIPGGQGSDQITVEEAKAAALAHAGLTESEVTFTQQKLEREDGRLVYDIEFYAPSAEYDSAVRTEYDYEIDAATGEIVKFDHDAESYNAPVDPSGIIITREAAQAIALEKVPGATADNVKKLKLDRDDGMRIYEVEIIYGGMEYELEINAADGTILEFEAESTHR